MESYLSFEPRYHELTSREGKPVWMPRYNPLRECVRSECFQISQAGGEVETRISKLPKALRRAAASTKRRQRYARWAHVTEPALGGLMVLGAVAMFAQMTCLVGASLAAAYDPVWFKGLTQLEALAISAAAGFPVVGVIVGTLARSWWHCANAH